jgi:diacylglycerol kinase (ATP)
MRAAAILGLGCSPRALAPFKTRSDTTWSLGLPASSQDADAILIFGGDGTIHRHLPSLVKLRLPVLIVPTGSGNDFARALHSRGVRDSLTTWRKFESSTATVRTIDLGVITPAADPHHPHYFCCVAGCGLDGEVARRANALPRWLRAHGGYVLSLPAALRAFDAPVMKVSIPNAATGSLTLHRDKPTLLIAFANAPAFGDGMKIAPQARLDDGLLDICIVDKITSAKLLRLLPSVYFGEHLRFPEVEYMQVRNVRLETEAPLDVYADGEYVCKTPVDVAVAPATLQVITN